MELTATRDVGVEGSVNGYGDGDGDGDGDGYGMNGMTGLRTRTRGHDSPPACTVLLLWQTSQRAFAQLTMGLVAVTLHVLAVFLG